MGYYSKGLGFIVHLPCGGVNVAANRTTLCPETAVRFTEIIMEAMYEKFSSI